MQRGSSRLRTLPRRGSRGRKRLRTEVRCRLDSALQGHNQISGCGVLAYASKLPGVLEAHGTLPYPGDPTGDGHAIAALAAIAIDRRIVNFHDAVRGRKRLESELRVQAVRIPRSQQNPAKSFQVGMVNDLLDETAR